MTSGRASPLVVLTAASTSQASVSVINYGLPSIGPELRAEFGLSLAELGGIITAGLLGSGLFLIAAGIAVDRYGTRAAMLSSVALSSGGLFLAAFADTKGVLFAGLFLFGVGTAVVPVAGTGELFHTYPAERRGWALGVRQMAVPLGGIIASVGLPLLQAAGGVKIALICVAVLVGVSGLAFGLVAGPPRPVDRSATQRAAFRGIFRAPGMVTLLAVAALFIVVLQALLVFAVPTARDAGLSSFWSGTVYFVINVAGVASRVAWGLVADRGGGTRRVRTLQEIGVLAAVGAGLFGLALHVGTPFVLVAVAIFAFGALGWNGVLYLIATEKVGPASAARAMGVASTVVFVLSNLAPRLTGAIAARAGWDAVWFGCIGVAALGVVFAWRLGRT